jgi:aminoglycoside N3'-acetyltransferase
MMTTSHSQQKLVADLTALGVQRSDTLFVHSSFKSLGPVEGGAATVVAALENVLGPDGLLLMPSFNLIEGGIEKRAANWNIATTPSTVGWLTEFFRTMPGTVRSDHYSHSVAARGKGAREFVADHRGMDGCISPWDLAPWGRTYGTGSPLMKAYRAGGKLLMLGVDYKSSTYMHVVEVMHWNRQLERDPKAEYFYINRPVLGEYWDGLGKQHRGRVGDAACRLFLIREFVDTLLAAVEKQPERFFKAYKK